MIFEFYSYYVIRIDSLISLASLNFYKYENPMKNIRLVKIKKIFNVIKLQLINPKEVLFLRILGLFDGIQDGSIYSIQYKNYCIRKNTFSNCNASTIKYR